VKVVPESTIVCGELKPDASSPAPAISPFSSICTRAASSMISPRAVFTTIASGRRHFRRRAESR
jgi:hypothetical protein